MNQEILNQYNIIFSNTVDFNKVFKLATGNTKVCSFLNDWRRVNEVDEDLISTIDSVLNGTVAVDDVSSVMVFVEMNIDNSFFYGSSDDPDFSMPTSDFKEIIMSWREFLMTTPLNGSSVSGSSSDLIV